MADPTQRLAVLIDADNGQACIASELLADISRYGRATIRRAYGDWTTSNLRGWKEVVQNHAIQPVQQFSHTSGKNATDSALIIDAMDLLHGATVDGFCIVSSDSDYTRLATRIREAGLAVYGYGERKTAQPFVAACDRFVYTETLRPDVTEAASPEPARPPLQPDRAAAALPASPRPPLRPMLEAAIGATAREGGWALLSAIGSQVGQTSPAFDCRHYGYPKLGELVRRQPYLEVRQVSVGEGVPQRLYVRLRDGPATDAPAQRLSVAADAPGP